MNFEALVELSRKAEGTKVPVISVRAKALTRKVLSCRFTQIFLRFKMKMMDFAALNGAVFTSNKRKNASLFLKD